MKKLSNWLRVGLFLVIVAAAVVYYILPALGTTAPGGPKLSFGGAETCQLGDALEVFNAAGFYMGESVQDQTYTGLSSHNKLKVYLSAAREQSCGTGTLVNKGDKWLKGVECMVYSFALRLEDGGHMTCDGTETLGNTKEAIHAAFGTPAERNAEFERYKWSRMGRSYLFTFYYDEEVCTEILAYQDDPHLSFRSY